MGRISKKRRSFVIKSKRKKKQKIKKLKEKYLSSKSKEEKNKIIDKIQRVSPHYSMKEILKGK